MYKFFDKYRDGDHFFWFFQFQFQFLTLNLENSDKTKSKGVDCDRANLSLQGIFFFSGSLLHEPTRSDLWIIGGGTEDRRFSCPKITDS